MTAAAAVHKVFLIFPESFPLCFDSSYFPEDRSPGSPSLPLHLSPDPVSPELFNNSNAENSTHLSRILFAPSTGPDHLPELPFLRFSPEEHIVFPLSI